MIDKEQDPQLSTPQDANTTKHINFREVEEGDNGAASGNNDNSSDEDSPTKKAWEELRSEQSQQSSGTE